MMSVPILRSRRRIVGLAGAAALLTALLATAFVQWEERENELRRAAQVAELRQLLRASSREERPPEFTPNQASGICSVSDVAPRHPPERCLALVWWDTVEHAGVIRSYTTYRILDGRPIPAGVGCCLGEGDFTWSSERPEP
jgi:hypothetical protein